uniref:Uncharacterized protein n=1 Tax=Spumella elongata TaxID=89044 RepID=A0A7S3H5G9_9STRA|mmetsp:Transcript_36030/g.62101  ORF Transcript_36030/g.62101 Transcript_36030/m.62101 type:complete len:601 (+) Transcript_36030:61-1863(+)
MIPVCNQPGMPDTDVVGVWTTTPFDALRDEESCWWSTWCCCLVSGRTAEAFQIGSSQRQVMGFVTFLLISGLIFLFVPIAGFLLLAGGLIYYAYYKAQLRMKIRELYQIPGTLMSDFVAHAFCPCCSVAQEAREVLVKGKPVLDFVYGEPLSNISFPQLQTGGYAPSSPNQTTTAENNDDSVSLVEHLKSVSLLSHLILRLWLCVVVSTFLALIINGKGLSILVLMAVFVQPFLILYFVYWRDPERSKHVSLDYVIKLFAVGFFMSTSQSIVFESILEGILGTAVMIVLLILNPHMNDNDDTDKNASAQITAALLPLLSRHGWSHMLSSAAGSLYQFASTMGDPAMDLHTDNYHSTSAHFLDTDTQANSIYHPLVTPPRFLSSNGTNDEDDNISGFSPSIIRRNIVIVVIALLIMAFVIAAGVEETMKHFAVRCCKFPAPLRDPKSVLVYMMTAALGFATSENIEYVFGADKSPIPHTSLVVGELVVLAMRVCMPIHVICSVMQATTFSKVLMGHESMNIFQILLPAVVLHGTFDFVLFLMGVIGAAYEVNEAALEAFSFILPIGITLVGVYLAYTGFEALLRTFENGWQAVADDNMAVL